MNKLVVSAVKFFPQFVFKLWQVDVLLSANHVVAQEDANGHAFNAISAITVSLTTTSSKGAFYGSGGTRAAITSVTFASGYISASFTYKDTAAGSATITASSAGLTSATTIFTINLNQVPKGGFGSTGSGDPWQQVVRDMLRVTIQMITLLKFQDHMLK